ncbi:MAG: ester cyclase [Actinobacteria bacterium]|nr:ester cyclase [Actinomycetota bacterium]
MGLFDDGADLRAPGGIQVSGRSGAELFYDTWHDAFPDNSIEAAVVFGAGGRRAEEARFSGTHTGTLRTPNGDISPTGKSVTSQFAAVVQVQDEKFASFHIYFDVAELWCNLVSCQPDVYGRPSGRQPPPGRSSLSRPSLSGQRPRRVGHHRGRRTTPAPHARLSKGTDIHLRGCSQKTSTPPACICMARQQRRGQPPLVRWGQLAAGVAVGLGLANCCSWLR